VVENYNLKIQLDQDFGFESLSIFRSKKKEIKSFCGSSVFKGIAK